MASKLGFTIEVRLAGRGRKGDVNIRNADGSVAHTDRCDLGDGRERTRLANKLVQRLGKGEREQWETALEAAHLKATEQHDAAVREAQVNPSSPCSPGSPGSAYSTQGGRICLTKHTFNGDEVICPLCNFSATVNEALRIDDGSGEIEQHFLISGALDDGTPLPPVRIRASEFMTMNWPANSWGLRAIVTAGQSSRDHLRAAIQWLSMAAAQRTVYKHTGWRLIGEHWCYLHAGGAIYQDGVFDQVSVMLDPPLDRFVLPAPPTGNALETAVGASLNMINLCPSIMFPLLGAVFRSVLGPSDFSLNFVGHSGLGKSEFTALAQQHFGADMHRLHLPANWHSTANALEGLAFLAKDAILVIDDFKPIGSKGDIDRMHLLADRILRAQGNRSGRTRCRADGTIRAPRPPRGTIILTLQRYISRDVRCFWREIRAARLRCW